MNRAAAERGRLPRSRPDGTSAKRRLWLRSTATASLLDRRARHGAVGAEHAAVAGARPQ
jgi:hypothetical protein